MDKGSALRDAWLQGIKQWLSQLFLVGMVVALIVLLPLLSQKDFHGKGKKTLGARTEKNSNTEPESPSTYQASDFWLSMSVLTKGHGGTD